MKEAVCRAAAADAAEDQAHAKLSVAIRGNVQYGTRSSSSKGDKFGSRMLHLAAGVQAQDLLKSIRNVIRIHGAAPRVKEPAATNTRPGRGDNMGAAKARVTGSWGRGDAAERAPRVAERGEGTERRRSAPHGDKSYSPYNKYAGDGA